MDFYKVYTECVNGYSAAMMTLTACESNKKFSRFMAVASPHQRHLARVPL